MDENYHKSGQHNHGGGKKSNYTHPTSYTAPQADPDAMDLSAARVEGTVVWTKAMQGKRPKTPAEKAAKSKYCFDNDLCVWCYGDDHYGDSCKTAIWNKDKEFYVGKGNKRQQGNAKS